MEWLQVRRRWGSRMLMAVVADGYKELRDGGAANREGGRENERDERMREGLLCCVEMSKKSGVW